MESLNPSGLLTLDFDDPDSAAGEAARFARLHPIAAVLGVDERTAVVAAAVAERLALPHDTVGAVRAAGNKSLLRNALTAAGVPSPASRRFSLDDDPRAACALVRFPCVLKPTFLAASRGVIRADGEDAFAAAWHRIAAILSDPDLARRGGAAARELLVEDFVPGAEVSLEGLLTRGRLRLLALFDKPDPLDGPFFEETIYVTPSRRTEAAQRSVRECAAAAAAALGLRDGPVHAELRLGRDEWGRDRAWMIEIAARSIGGLCSRTLTFGTGMSLEEIILRHALALPIASLERERRAAGVMMIPIPGRGVLEEVAGLDEARAVPHVEDVVISIHKGQEVVPLPEGSRYLGFIFSRADTPADAEAALRLAHRRLRFSIV